MPAPRHRPVAVTFHAIAFSLAVLLAALVLAAAAGGVEFRGRVIGVNDGDTITVLHDRQPEKIRLHGIDAPEKGQPFSERAKQFASGLAFGRAVTIRVVDHDKYGRTVADVVLADGRSLNRELVRAGYAWWYRRYSNDRTLAELEAHARATRSGLWADPHAVPPWEWRAGRLANR